MVQKSSAIILAILGLSAITLATPIPKKTLAGLAGKGLSRTLSKGASKTLSKGTSKTLSKGASRSMKLSGGGGGGKSKSSLSRIASQTAKHGPSVLDAASSGMNVAQQYQDLKQSRQPIMDNTGREYDDADILERDYEFEDIEARSPKKRGGGARKGGFDFLKTAKDVGMSAGKMGLDLVKDTFLRELEERSYDLEELD